MAEAVVNHRCAVVGYPIAHSQSPHIHQSFAQSCGIALQYDRILAEPEHFTATVHQFFQQGGHGLNITLPFKTDAAYLAEIRSPAVDYADAANTLWLNQDGKLCADNTDGMGLVNALKRHGIPLTDRRILLIGAGGAACGVYHPLLLSRPKTLDIANRTPEKAEQIMRQQGRNGRILPLNHTTDEAYDLIIHATSAGIHHEALTLPKGIIEPGRTVCYDMTYGKITPFMQWAQSNHAAHIYDGYSMLIEQARLSFQHWFNTLPPYSTLTTELQ